MRPEIALARLNPKTQKYQMGFGGIGGLSQAELSMCIGGLTRLEYIYAEHSLMGVEWERTNGIIYPKNPSPKYLEMYKIVFDDMMKKNPSWSKPSTVHLAMAVMVALYEAINPRSRMCGPCNGTGSITNSNGQIEAHRMCNGTGKRVLTGEQYAEYLKVGINDWRRVWQRRYSEILRLLFEVECTVLAKVSKKLLPLTE